MLDPKFAWFALATRLRTTRRRGLRTGEVDEAVEVRGEHRVVPGLVRPDLPIEAGQHGPGEAVVEIVSLAPNSAVADDDRDGAMKDSRDERPDGAGDAERHVPGVVEGRCAVAKFVGGTRAQARGAGREGNRAAIGERLEEQADTLGRPAVATHGAAVGRDPIGGDGGGNCFGKAI